MISHARALLALVGAATLAACGPGTPSTSSACKAALLPGDLVVTEVFADFKAPSGSTGTDTGREWFEIYNAKGAPIDLDGVTITHSRPDGSRASTHTLTQATMAPGQFFTLGNAAPDLVPPYVDHGYGAELGDLFNTGGGKLTLSCGDDEIDSADYDSIKEGHARELTSAQAPDYTANNNQSSWCQANDTEFEAGNFGTPGTANDCQPIVTGQCNDGGTMRNAVAPAPGDLVITEVMPSPAKVSDATGEWFEAKVVNDIDLNGVGLDRLGDPVKPEIMSSTECLHVTAGSYIVFARSKDMALNGGIPAASFFRTFKFSLVDTQGDVAIVSGTTVVDAVTWASSSDGKSLQLDPTRVDAAANDAESNFCDATSAYGTGDLGTPGTANSRCATLPDPGKCVDGSTPRDVVSAVPGALVISEFLAGPKRAEGEPTGTPREWFEIINTGTTAFDLNGLAFGRIGAAGELLRSASCLSVKPGGFAVFAHSNIPTTNGIPNPIAATFRFGLVDNDGDIQVSSGTTVLDFVKWTSVTSGASKQVAPNHLNTSDNDDAGGASYCAGTTTYGSDPLVLNKGTPGAANPPCP